MQQNRSQIWIGASDLCYFINSHVLVHLFLTNRCQPAIQTLTMYCVVCLMERL